MFSQHVLATLAAKSCSLKIDSVSQIENMFFQDRQRKMTQDVFSQHVLSTFLAAKSCSLKLRASLNCKILQHRMCSVSTWNVLLYVKNQDLCVLSHGLHLAPSKVFSYRCRCSLLDIKGDCISIIPPPPP